ncbi:MAG: hypothetical protein DRI57_21820 [Deltaproteobacteria bacterium]|nr:MAG: hypothetical protein DRI57_21820 [Deltaproteobacteria bacterium]
MLRTGLQIPSGLGKHPAIKYQTSNLKFPIRHHPGKKMERDSFFLMDNSVHKRIASWKQFEKLLYISEAICKIALLCINLQNCSTGQKKMPNKLQICSTGFWHS